MSFRPAITMNKMAAMFIGQAPRASVSGHPWDHPITFFPQGLFSATIGFLVGVHMLKMILSMIQE